MFSRKKELQTDLIILKLPEAVNKKGNIAIMEKKKKNHYIKKQNKETKRQHKEKQM